MSRQQMRRNQLKARKTAAANVRKHRNSRCWATVALPGGKRIRRMIWQDIHG